MHKTHLIHLTPRVLVPNVLIPVLLALALVLAGCDTASLPTAAEDEPAVTLGPRASFDGEATSFWDGTPQDTSGGYTLEVIEHEGSVCYLVTFEGGGPLIAEIYPESGGLVPGTPIRFSSGWRTISASLFSIPTPPSGDIIAIYGFGNIPAGEITFEEPVARISFAYLSFLELTLNAYDAEGTIVVTATGAPTGGDAFAIWTPLAVNAGSNLISRVELMSSFQGTVVDNLDICVETPLEVTIDLQPDNADNAVDPFNLNSTKPATVALRSTADFDATSLDLSTVRLGDPLLTPRIAAQASTAADVDGDGILDVVFDFGPARDFGAAGALDGSSMEVELTGSGGGVEVIGTDVITIVGGGA